MRWGARAAVWSIVGFALLTFVGPVVLGFFFDPDRVDSALRYASPGAEHWLGTDALGRDVLVRLLLGARSSLLVAGASALVATAFGALVGLYAGYRGGRWDRAFLRFTDVFRTVPKLPLFILLAALDLGAFLPAGTWAEGLQLVLVLSVISWVFVARTTRALVLELKSRTFVLAARALGLSERRIVRQHLLPHCLGTIAVAGALLLGDLVLYESVLSYLGLGFQPPAPSLGSLMRNGLSELDRAPLLTVLPGLLTLWLVASVHFLVDGVGEGPGSG
jgi:peptide/nickel transport system permease protein